MKQRDWWIIKHRNSRFNSAIFKTAITDYGNLQMMGGYLNFSSGFMKKLLHTGLILFQAYVPEKSRTN